MRRQCGVALIALLAVLAIGASAYLIRQLNVESGAMDAIRKNRNADVLNRAKQTLIGHVALLAARGDEDNPGRLTCPEAAGNIGGANEGIAAGNCALPAIGRFPWRTFGMDKLVDSASEPLWYVVSPGWALSNVTIPPLTTYINSNSTGQLLVNARSVGALSQIAGLATAVSAAHGFRTGDIVKIAGATPTGYNVAVSVTVIDANRFTYPVDSALATPAIGTIKAGDAAVALIIAPGRAMNVAASADCAARNQARAVPAPAIDALDYLECYSAANGAFFATGPTASFNDQVVAITAAEVLGGIEAAIANRIRREIIPTLSDVYLGTAWGLAGRERMFPFAATFGDPSLATTSFHGAPPATQGLVPFNYGEACVPATEPRCLLMAFSPTTPPVAYKPAGLPSCATSPATSPGGCGTIQTQTCNWDPTDTSAVVCDGEYLEDNTSPPATLAGPGMRIEMTATITNVGKGLRVLYAWIGARDNVALGAWQVMTPDITTVMNLDGSATIRFGATLPNIDVMGWGTYAQYRIRLKVADHPILSTRPREINFNTGNSTEIRVGQTVVGATSGASGRVARVTVQSGNWEVGPGALGRLTFYGVTGSFVNNESLRVLGLTRAQSTSADSVADSNLSWFARNEWYRSVYYAVASEYVWERTGTCSHTPAVTCLQVANLPIAADQTKQRALLVLMGKRVTAQTRPSANLADYLDSAENRNPDGVFEQLRVGASSNDRFITISKNP